MSNSIDRSVVNFEQLDAEGSTAKAGSPRRAGFGGSKKNQGPSLNVKKGGKSAAAKKGMNTPTKTSGKFGSSKEGKVSGKR